MVALYTGRAAFYPIVCPPQNQFDQDDRDGPVPDLEQSVRTLEVYQPRYLTLVPNFLGEVYFRRWLRALIRRYPDHVDPVYQGEDPRYIVYELRYPFPALDDVVSCRDVGASYPSD